MAWGRKVADWTMVINRLALLAVVAGLAAGSVSCQGSSAGSAQCRLQPSPSPPAAAKISGDPPVPVGVDEILWDSLVDRLKQVVEDVVDGNGEDTLLDEILSTPVLALTPQDNETILLTWPYCHPGDYNQDGQVGVGDLTPLALHFGKTADAADWAQAKVVDGDGNGEVNISDVTPIGLNFGSTLGWYHVEEAASAQAQEWILRARVALVSAQASADGCLTFALQLSDPQSGYFYRVAPRGGADGVGLAQPSAPVQFIVPTPTTPTLQATDGEYRDRVELSWTASPWATHYKVYRDAQSPPVAELYHETSWADYTVWDANEHTYWVRAMNERTQSGYGDGDVGFKAASPAAWAAFNGDARHTGRSNAVGPETGNIKWSYSGRPVDYCVSCVVSADSTVYVHTIEVIKPHVWNSYLTAVDAEGTALWDVLLADSPYSPPCIGPDGVVYVQTCNSYLYAIDENGIERWVLKLDQLFPANESPVCLPNGTILTYVDTKDDYLLALDPSGHELWRTRLAGRLADTPALGLDGSIYTVLRLVEIEGVDYALQAFSPSGKSKWIFPLPEWAKCCPSIADDGTAYIVCWDGNLYAIKPDGTEAWRVYLGFRDPTIYSTSATVGHDGTIFVGSSDHYLHALNPDGTEKWKFSTGLDLYPESASAAIDCNGNVYIPAHSGYVFALDPEGNERWRSEAFSRAHLSSCCALGPDGTLYFVAASALHAIGTP